MAKADERGVAAQHDHALERHAELGGADLGQRRLVRLALRRHADGDEHGAVGIDPHVGALERSNAGALEVRRESDADGTRAAAPAVALAAPALVVGQRQRAVEGGDVIGRVVRDRDAVAIRVAGLVGHRLLADQVAAAQVCSVQAEPPRRAVEEAVEDERRLGASSAAVRAHERLVGDDVDALAGEVRDTVGPREVVDGVEADHVAERRVRAVIAGEARLDRREGAVAAHAEPRAMPLVAVGRRGQEVLAPRLDPLHRAPQPPRDHRDEHLFGVGVPLDAEAPADVGRQHAHARLAEPEGSGDGAAHGVGDLGRGPQGEEAIGRRGMRDDAARLDRHAGHAREVERRLHHDVGPGEAARDVANGARRHARHVVGPVVEDPRRPRCGGALDARGGRPRLPRHADGLGAVGRAVRIVGDDDGHRLAHVAHHRLGDRLVVVRAHGRRRRERRNAGRALGQIARGEHGHDAGQPTRGARVDRAHMGVGVRAAHDGGVEQPLEADVIHVAAAAGEKTTIFLAKHASADGGGHGRVAV